MMDESVDAYVPSKAIPQTVLMEMYGGSLISRFPEGGPDQGRDLAHARGIRIHNLL